MPAGGQTAFAQFRPFVRIPDLPQQRRGDSPGLTDGELSSGECEGSQVGDALGVTQRGQQGFAPPDDAIRAPPRAIERQAQDPGIEQGVFNHGRRHMGVMMPHPHPWPTRATGPVGAVIARVAIVQNRRGAQAIQGAEAANLGFEPRTSGKILKVADMSSQHRLRPVRQGDRALLVTSECQPLARRGHLERPGGQSTSQPNGCGLAGDHSHNTVVLGRFERRIGMHDQVGQRRQPAVRILHRGDQRFALPIPTGDDQGCAPVPQQQPMPACRRGHQPNIGQAAGDGRGESAAHSLRHQHNRIGGAVEFGPRCVVELTPALGHGQIAHQQCERF